MFLAYLLRLEERERDKESVGCERRERETERV